MVGEGRHGRLAFVGLGLHDDRGITLAGLEEMRSADVVFAEVYTATLKAGSLERLGQAAGKEVRVLSRAQVEDGSIILEAAKERRVAFLVVGDPMTATTHVELRLRAIEQGIETAIIFGASVLTAVPGQLGLQHYKFGKTTSLPFPQEGYMPTSPYEVIAENRSMGMHTMVLLDIRAESGLFMTANQAFQILLDMEKKMGKGLMTENTLVCVVARAGSPDCMARAGRLGDMIKLDFGGPMHTIVIPGNLHFMEEDALKAVAKLQVKKG